MTCLSRSRLVSALTIALLTVCLSLAASAQTYTIIDLGTLPGFTGSVGQGINASGQVTGYLQNGFFPHAFLYSGGKMTDLGTLGIGDYSYGLGINLSGAVVGYSGAPLKGDFAFLYTPETGMVALDALIDNQAHLDRANGINDSGQITGVGEFYSRAFLFSGGTAATDLGFPWGQGINASGQITGFIDLGTFHAILYSEGTVTDLGVLGGDFRTLSGSFSVGNGINASAQVTGTSTVNPDENDDVHQHAFLYSGGTMTDLGTLGGKDSSGHAINTSGQVVGDSSTADSAQHAFLYTPGKGIVDLNTLLPSGSGWTLISANAINDAGQITGQGTNPNGDTHAFVLSPLSIESLIGLVQSFNLPSGIATSLLAKLNAAQAAGTGSGTYCAGLTAFTAEVQGLAGNKLTSAQADQLIATAGQLKTSASCQ